MSAGADKDVSEWDNLWWEWLNRFKEKSNAENSSRDGYDGTERGQGDGDIVEQKSASLEVEFSDDEKFVDETGTAFPVNILAARREPFACAVF